LAADSACESAVPDGTVVVGGCRHFYFVVVVVVVKLAVWRRGRRS
jgi:hypothetical protein